MYELLKKYILIILFLFPMGILHSQNPDIAWIKSGHQLEHPMSDISRDGKFIVSLSYWPDEIKIWDVMSDSLVRQFKVSPPIYCCIKSVKFSPNRKYVAVGVQTRTIYLFDAENGNLKRTITPSDGWNNWVKTIAFSPDSRYIVTNVGKKIEIYDVETGSLYKAFGSTGDISTQTDACIFSPDGKYLLVGIASGTLQLWDIQNEKIVRTHPFSAYYLNLAFSNDGSKYAASAEGVGDDVSVWDFQSGNLITKIGNYTSASILFSVDGKYLLCGQLSGVAIHELPFGTLTRFLPCRGGYWISLSDDGKYLVASWLQIYLFDFQSGTLLRTYAEIRDNITSLTFSPTGEEVACSLDNGIVYIIDCATGNIITSFKRPYPESIAYSPDGKMIAAAGISMILWDVGSEQIIYKHSERDSSGAKITFSPDGKYVTWGSDNRKITVMDVTTKQIYKTYYSEKKSPTLSFLLIVRFLRMV